MKAKNEKAATCATHNDDFVSSLNGIIKLFIDDCVDDVAPLAALEAIPTNSDLQRKWVTYWKAKVLLAVARRLVPLEKYDYRKTATRLKSAQRSLEQLVPRGWDIPENERELVFGAMLALGQLYKGTKAAETLCRVAALTRFYDSPLRSEAESAYNFACLAMLELEFEGMVAGEQYEEYITEGDAA